VIASGLVRSSHILLLLKLGAPPCIQKSPSLDHIQSQMNPITNFTPHLFKIVYKMIIPTTGMSVFGGKFFIA
jgi:hypothetical protein